MSLNIYLITNIMKKKILPLLMLFLLSSMSFAATYTLKVTVPAATIVCYASGDFNSWAQPGTLMTKVTDNPKVFTLDVELADTVGSRYKFCAGPSWNYEQSQSADFWLGKLTTNGDVVDAFKAYYDPAAQLQSVTIDVLVPAGVFDCYLTGNFNSWNPTANKMIFVDSTANGKEFKLTIEVTDSTLLEYKFIAGPGWAYEQTQSANYKFSVDGRTVVCDAFKALYDPSKVGDITIKITSVPAGTVDVYLIGSFNNWTTTTAIKTTNNGDGTYTAVILQQQNIEYKCYNYPDWAYEEATDASGTNISNRKASFEVSPVVEITVAFWKKLHTNTQNATINKFNVRSINGHIQAQNISSDIVIYDLNGRTIESVRLKGSFTSKSLNQGLYIIRIDGQSQKVFVK
jgi:hypothetical protein